MNSQQHVGGDDRNRSAVDRWLRMSTGKTKKAGSSAHFKDIRSPHGFAGAIIRVIMDPGN